MLRLGSITHHHAQSKERGHHTAPNTHLTVLSLEPDTQVRPSGLMATEVTQPEWPSSVACSWPVPMSHSLCRGCGGVGKACCG